jgi:hypothetical protein
MKARTPTTRIEAEMTKVKKALISVSWCFMVMQFAGFAVIVVVTWFKYSDTWWEFFSTKIPYMWVNLLAPAAVIILIELGTPGNTINAIMDVNKDSPWQDKLVAVIFMVSLSAIGAYVGKTI